MALLCSVDGLAVILESRLGASGEIEGVFKRGAEMTVTLEPIDPDAVALPATFVNRFQITLLGELLVRLSFAEALPPGSQYRTAIIMTAADAKELAMTILNLTGALEGRAS